MVAIRSAPMLRDEHDVVVGRRVQAHSAAVGAHRHPAHRLHAAGQHQVIPARTHLLRGGVDGLQAGRAEPVELHTAGGDRHARCQHCGAGDVAALVAHR